MILHIIMVFLFNQTYSQQSFPEIIQSKVAGVYVSVNSYSLYNDYFIQIRGVKSFSGSFEPLYILDGIPLYSKPDINTNNIAKIKIIKGINGSYRYGNRAKNGVIEIETKKGKK